MRFVLIAPGYKPFPPSGWGAVESIVWDYYQNLSARGFIVHIVNTTNEDQMVAECNDNSPDIVHIMFDDHIGIAPRLNCKRIFYTSHYAYLTNPGVTMYGPMYKVLQYKEHITINAISEKIAEVYRKYGFDRTINIVPNGAREDRFHFKNDPAYPNKSIYVAKIEYRKRQYVYQNIPNIDFAGNYQDSPFHTQNNNYLGEWNRETLYANLTEYANLILLSDGEADPLVVKEALMAGLGVVVSECACANLDLTKPYITVIPNDKLDDLPYVEEEINKNREISLRYREEIRNYALENFSWKKIIDRYIGLL
jgi:glycosyltransferase involved in cell wall biosynthesis